MRNVGRSAVQAATKVGAGVGVAVLALTGCAVDESSTASGGSSGSGGPVTIACVVQEDLCQLQASEFTKATGTPANYVRMSAGEAVARLSASKASPEFDVLAGGSADGHIAAAAQGLTQKYVSPGAADIPDKYKAADGTWTGTYVGVLAFCSNKDVLGKLGLSAPTSWQDLLAPGFKRQIAMAHPSTSGTSYTALWTEVELHDGDQDAALAYFRQLHGNVLQYPKSGAAPGQMAGRGEIGTGIIFGHDCRKYVKEGFDSLEVTYPKDGTGYEIGAVSLVAGAKNAEGGKKYIDWMLTKQAQELGPQVGSFQVPTNPDATITEDMVDLDDVDLVTYDPAQAGAARSELTARFDREVAPQPKGE